VERFRQEGRIASMIAHPRCVFVLAVDEEAGRPYIVMERMPGATLKDVVDREGPLPADRAIALILDAIEGLQEAHRLDVIHRDVKPSNCFLEADGRVKVGDFGLAKSLVKDAHLTRTGAFVGTPHFASPEQIRGEPTDARTDVYSTAATLYYLLTGKPPHHGSDSGAALARILTDPPPRLRQARPELPPALERIVLRALERDRERRWPDLEAFRQALLTLSPPPLTWPDLPPRVGAYVFDFVLLRLVGAAAFFLFGALLRDNSRGRDALVETLAQGIFTVVFIGYFSLLEHLAGASLGKRLLRLRVCSLALADPPSASATAARTLLFFTLVNGGFLVAPLVKLLAGVDMVGSLPLGPTLGWGWLAVGPAVLMFPMRAANGYRGLHEILTGTRVIRVAEARPQAHPASGGWLLSFLLNRRLDRSGPQVGTLPGRIGGFTIRGALRWTPADKVLLGEDASFGRRVFLWLRPASAPALDPARRDVGRRTRLRWLGSGKQGELQWDALLAPSGSPLPDFIQSEGTVPWPQARALLLELAGELAAACADGTLPRSLTPAQVWIHADGRVQLADLALRTDPEEVRQTAPDEQRALILLRQVAELILEGQARGVYEARTPLRATMPDAARLLLDRLVAEEGRFETVQQAHAALMQDR
jgi:hypothetical protein